MHQNDLILAPRKCFCLCDLLILAEKNVKVGAYYDRKFMISKLIFTTSIKTKIANRKGYFFISKMEFTRLEGPVTTF